MQAELETNRLILRPPEMRDAPAMAKNLSDPDIARMTATIPYPYFAISAEFWIMKQRANRKNGASYAYAIETKAGDFAGSIELFFNESREPEIGYWIAKAFWNQGFAKEAARAIIAETFRCFDTPFIDAGYYADNPASGRVLEKLGFEHKEEGSLVYSIARGCAPHGIELRLMRPETITRPMQSTRSQLGSP